MIHMFIRILAFFRWKIYYYINKNKFKYLSSQSRIYNLLKIDGKKNISIHSGVVIQQLTWLAAVPLTNSKDCCLSIGKGSVIGNFNHIYATCRIDIGENVLTADKVYISDNQHEFENIDIPILSQGIKQLPTVKIGNGSWIGENVCIIGANIGKNCIIGANSVVIQDIPDYSLAVGAPARVVKIFNLKTKKWEKIQKKY